MGQRFTAVYLGGSFRFNKIVSCDLVVCGGKECVFEKQESETFLLYMFPYSRVCALYIHYNDTSSKIFSSGLLSLMLIYMSRFSLVDDSLELCGRRAACSSCHVYPSKTFALVPKLVVDISTCESLRTRGKGRGRAVLSVKRRKRFQTLGE